MIDPVGDRRPPISPQLAWRVALLGGIALALFAIVFFRLWYLQVLSGDQYLAEANDNQVRQERIQAPRGDVVDRNGETIVTNRRAIVVEISPAGLPDAEREAAATWGQRMTQRSLRPTGFKGEPTKIPDIPTQELRDRLRRLAGVLEDTTATEIQRRIIQSLAQVPYAPIRVETDVPRSVMNYVQERQTLFPSVTVEQVYLRQYPRTTLAAQMLGTVGEIQLKQLKWKHFRGVKQGTVVGQGGLEYQYDRYLRGTDGSREIQVDALGNPKGELREVAPKAGQRLKLSLDLALQREGQEALTGQGNPGGQPAAFVAMNPDNGEILGMGSYPSFDPNLLTKPITQERYDALFGEQAGSPLFNRATNGLYSTGSTFKVVTALAGMQSGTIAPATRVEDNGCVEIGDRKFCNAKSEPNGSVDMQQAIKVSSDVYFYLLGQNLDAKKGQLLQKYARELGFGHDTGIDLPSEADGVVPDRAWRKLVGEEELKCRKKRKVASCGISDMRGWNTGDNVNLAIGQGDLQATPLQLAVAYSTLATDGRVAHAARRPGGREPVRRAHPAHRARAGPPHQDRRERSLGDHERAQGGSDGGRRHVARRVLRLAQGPARLRQDRHRPAHRQAGHVVVRGVRPRRPRAQPDRRRDHRRGVRLLRRRGRRPDHAAHPLAALRGREEVRPRGVEHAVNTVQAPTAVPAPLRGVLRLPLDPLLIVATLGLAAISLAAIGISTQDDIPGSPTYYLTRQAIFFAVGAVVLVVISRLDYSRLRELKYVVYGFMLVLILAVLGFGSVARGSRRAIDLPFFQIQPSELGKVLLVVALAGFVVDRSRRLRERDTTAIIVLLALVPAAMVMIQPDLGSALVYIVIVLAVLFAAGTSWKHFAGLAALTAGAVALALVLAPVTGVTVLHDYQVERLTSFLHPSGDPGDAGYQQNQAGIAIGAGQKTGRGVGATQTRLNFLPEHHTDFVFAVIGERWGFVGAALVLSLYALLIWRGLRILTMSKNLYGALLAAGIVAMLMFQVFVNVGMNIGIMPITGIPLPLMSYGGSSVLTTLIAVGLLQSIYAQGRAAASHKGRITAT